MSSDAPASITVDAIRQRMQQLELAPAWSYHSRQSTALDEAASTNATVVICDRPPPAPRGSKMYFSGGLRRFWGTLGLKALELRNYYEMLYVDRPAHFYIDFEYYPQYNSEQDAEFPFEERRRIALSLVFKELTRACPEAARVDVMELDSSKEGKKFSRHFVFHVHGHMFADIRHCGAFQRHLQQRAIAAYGPTANNPYFAWTSDPADPSRADGVRDVRKPIVDHGVYTRHRPMRLPWCTKVGEYRPLIPITHWVADRVPADNGAAGGWQNVHGDVDEWTAKLPVSPNPRHPIMSYDMLKTCMILCATDEFLRTCTPLDDGADDAPVVRLIRLREPDGSEPQSSSLLLSYRQQQRVLFGDGLRVAVPDLIADGALAGYRPPSATPADQAAAEREMGKNRPGCIDERHAKSLLERPVVLYDRMRRSAMETDSVALQVENACLADMIMAMEGLSPGDYRENATQLCVELGDVLCAHRGFRTNGRSEQAEFVDYRWIIESAMMFGYQIRTGNCSVCNRVHHSNNLKMLVMLEPPQWFQDPEYPEAPVVYYKCYSTGHRSRPHALHFYTANDASLEDGASVPPAARNLRERLDAYIEHSRRMFRHAPRSILSPLLSAPVSNDQVVIDLCEDE